MPKLLIEALRRPRMCGQRDAGRQTRPRQRSQDRAADRDRESKASERPHGAARRSSRGQFRVCRYRSAAADRGFGRPKRGFRVQRSTMPRPSRRSGPSTSSFGTLDLLRRPRRRRVHTATKRNSSSSRQRKETKINRLAEPWDPSFTPDGKLLVCGTRRRPSSVYVWDAATFEPRTTVGPFTYETRSICFSPDSMMSITTDRGYDTNLEPDVVAIWDSSPARCCRRRPSIASRSTRSH